jgi:hypothetical protein
MKIAAIFLAVFLPFPASPQSAPPSGIFGRVTSVPAHEPLRRAMVKVYTSRNQWDAITDGEGRFQFPDLVKAEYTLVARRDGFSERAYKVELSDFDDHKELPIELFPQGLITGKVIDNFGEPLVDTSIEVLGPATRGGPVQVLQNAQTNDLGEFRVAGLDPGTYQVRATYRHGGPDDFISTPMWLATATFAERIAVKSGSVINGVDFVLTPAHPAVVRGTIRTESGTSPTGYTPMWIQGTSGEGGSSSQSLDGKFEIRDVGPGSWILSVDSSDPPGFGTATVPVRGDDVNGVEIILHPVPIVQGVIRIDGIRPKPEHAGVFFMSLERSIGRIPMEGKPDSNGSFRVGLRPGEYTVSLFAYDGFEIEGMTFDGKPVVNQRIRVEPSAEPKSFELVVKAKP